MDYKHLIISVFLVSSSFSASAATYTINSNTDSNDHTIGDGLCDWDSVTSGDQCSIRAAIDESNDDSTEDTILIPPRGNDLAWEHTGANPWCIASPVTLSGTRPGVKIAGTASTTESVFEIDKLCGFFGDPTNIVIENVHIDGTGSPSRAIELSYMAELLLRRCTISGFEGDGEYVDDSISVSSFATGITIDSCRIVGNPITGLSFSAGDSRIINTVISGNGSASAVNSGVHTYGGFSSSSSTTVFILNSLIANNVSNSVGAGIYISQGSELHLINSTVSNNQSGLSGAGVYVGAAISDSVDGGRFHSNNSTIASNKGWIDDDTPFASGSGLDVSTSFNGNDDAMATIVNTLIAGNTTGSTGNEIVDDCDGDVDSNGYNFIQTSTNCSITDLSNSGTNVLDQDPLLGALTNNGGSNKTHAVGAASLVIDGGDILGCEADHDLDPNTADQDLPDDQRGLSRPRNSRCDVGAVEHFTCVQNLADLTLSNATVSEVRLEQACNSIDVQGTFDVSSTGHLHLRSPINRFENGFSVAKGGNLVVTSQTPIN